MSTFVLPSYQYSCSKTGQLEIFCENVENFCVLMVMEFFLSWTFFKISDFVFHSKKIIIQYKDFGRPVMDFFPHPTSLFPSQKLMWVNAKNCQRKLKFSKQMLKLFHFSPCPFRGSVGMTKCVIHQIKFSFKYSPKAQVSDKKQAF